MRVALPRPARIFGIALRNFYRDGAFDRSAVVAYYSLLSVGPSLYLFCLVLSGLLPAEEAARTAFTGARAFVPASLVPVIESLELNLKLDRRLVLIALPGLVWIALSAFLSLELGVNVAFRTVRRRRFWLARLKAFAGAAMAALLLVISAAVSNTLAWIDRNRERLSLPQPVAGARRLLVLVLLAFAAFTLLYKILPRGNVRWRAAVLAAAVSVGLWEIARSAFGMFLRSSAYYGLLTGSLAGVVAFLLWIYTAVAVLLLGAEIAAILNQNRAGPPEKSAVIARSA